MNSHMPKIFEIDQNNIDGYLFFTNNREEASHFGLDTVLADMRMSESQLPRVWLYYAEGYESMRDSIVLTVRTSNLRDGFEIDPEYHTISLPGDEKARQHFLAKGNLKGLESIQRLKSIWYRYKGDIPLKYILYHGTVRYGDFSSKMIDGLNAELDSYKMADDTFE
jgi:hypothetical protein